ncbi:unnamed protein product [Camellia sinensis]
MDSMNSDSGFVTSSGNQHALREIAANVASDGVKHSTLNPGSSGRLYSTDSAGSSEGNYESVSVEMSEPVTCSREQGPGKMIQTIDPSLSGCSVNNGHFICKDALTMLLLALPSHMWSGIKEPNLSAEFNSLVSIESVPHILKKECKLHKHFLRFLTNTRTPCSFLKLLENPCQRLRVDRCYNVVL